jgi:hypothetical protein
MTGAWRLGNDVVDTLHPGGRGKAQNDRFLRRVCSGVEGEVVRSSPDPDLALWVHWAAKEAVFKTASKAQGGPPVFRQPLFEVAFPQECLLPFLDPRSPQPTLPLRGTGRYLDLRFRLWLKKRDTCIHAVSWIDEVELGDPEFLSECRRSPGTTRGPASGLEGRFSPLEWECVTHRASALTRLGARKSLAAAWKVPEEKLEVRCGPGPPGRRIPSVWLDGEDLKVDLTLSHHGRFLAWAFLSR